MKTLCIICQETLADDAAYFSHMQTVHSGKTQLEALQQEKEIEQNIPKVIPLDKEAPVPPEFTELAQKLDKPTPPPQKPSPVLEAPKGGVEPLKLKYIWEGNCPTCNTDVRTIVTKVEGRWFTTAYCLSHGELAQKEVQPLEKDWFCEKHKCGGVGNFNCFKCKKKEVNGKPSVSKKTPK